MNLLESHLPDVSLRISGTGSQFLDECARVCDVEGWRFVRVPPFHKSDGQRVDIHFAGPAADVPLLTLVAHPNDPLTLRVYVVADWKSSPIAFDEFVVAAATSAKQLLRAHAKMFGSRYRLRYAGGGPGVDLRALNCTLLRYAVEKFSPVIRVLATDPADARTRLASGWLLVQPVRADSLPTPLDRHFATWLDAVGRRELRMHGWGATATAYVGTSNAKAAQLLGDLVDITNAVMSLGAWCRDRSESTG